jgi:alkanesulfonate monooxygenase SsuD/methylene tetrahydromethanopterin reductase-like flavin-dependent oxidoreductase (luciferase family)
MARGGRAGAPRGVPLLIGGAAEPAIERTVRWGAGWTAGASAPDEVRTFAQRLGAAWSAARRSGRPRIVALAYFGLGPLAHTGIDGYIRPYYAYLNALVGAPRDRELAGTRVGARSGPVDPVDAIASTVAGSAAAVRDTAAEYAAAGVDYLVLCPVLAELQQIDRLARAVL